MKVLYAAFTILTVYVICGVLINVKQIVIGNKYKVVVKFSLSSPIAQLPLKFRSHTC
jgi:hypothetical protein